MVRTCGALYILTWKCASRQNGVHFFDTSTSKKWSEHGVLCNALYILTWKCASRHNGVHLFDISTSKSGPNPSVLNALPATTARTFWTSQLPKVDRTWCALYILTWKRASRQNGVHFFDTSTSKSGPSMGNALYILTWRCASRHNGVHLFDISTSKSGPNPSVLNVLPATTARTFWTSQLPKVDRTWCALMCFVHFDLEMCFAPERRALFGHLNYQKWTEHGVLCTFWLGNVLRATMARTFSTSQLPKVARSLQVFWHFWLGNVLRATTACNLSALIWPAGSAPPTFRPSGATNHWQNTVNCDFHTFSRSCIFFLLTLSLLWSSHFSSSPLWLFPPLLFHFSILSEVWLLNFLRWSQYVYVCLKGDHWRSHPTWSNWRSKGSPLRPNISPAWKYPATSSGCWSTSSQMAWTPAPLHQGAAKIVLRQQHCHDKPLSWAADGPWVGSCAIQNVLIFDVSMIYWIYINLLYQSWWSWSFCFSWTISWLDTVMVCSQDPFHGMSWYAMICHKILGQETPCSATAASAAQPRTSLPRPCPNGMTIGCGHKPVTDPLKTPWRPQKVPGADETTAIYSP